MTDDWENVDFWAKLCPQLSISDSRPSEPDEAVPSVDKSQIEQLGFVEIDNEIADIEELRKGIESLHQQGLPPVCIILYDQVWKLASKSYKYLKQVTKEPTYDVLAWYINKNSSGFSPHRDRQPEDAPSSFDGAKPKLLTHWIALSDATPSSSCLYFVPKTIDPGYLQGDIEDQEPLSRALSSKNAYQFVRACPRKAGQSVIFTHRIIHWGSARLDPAAPPRVAISFVASDPSFEKSYINVKDEWPTFEQRLLLVRAQMLIYHERLSDMTATRIRECFHFCRKHHDNLESTYRSKVYYEFVRAMKQAGEEDDEEVMETMLLLEEEGEGDMEFRDDFSEPSIENGEEAQPSDDSDEEADVAGFSFEDTKRRKIGP